MSVINQELMCFPALSLYQVDITITCLLNCPSCLIARGGWAGLGWWLGGWVVEEGLGGWGVKFQTREFAMAHTRVSHNVGDATVN